MVFFLKSHYAILQDGLSQCVVFQSSEPELFRTGLHVRLVEWAEFLTKVVTASTKFSPTLSHFPVPLGCRKVYRKVYRKYILFPQAVEKYLESHACRQTYARQSGDAQGKPTHTIPHQRASLGGTAPWCT